MCNLIRYTLLPLLIGAIIFIVTCLITPEQVPEMPKDVLWDKLAHFGMFFLLSAISMYYYFKLHKSNPLILKWIFWGFIIPVIYGGLIELLQKYVFSYRGAEWGDWVADILGSLTATIFAIIFLKKRKR